MRFNDNRQLATISTAMGTNVYRRAEDNQLVTNTRALAEAFDKEHRNILRTCREVLGDGYDTQEYALLHSFAQAHIQEATYIDEQGKSWPMYELTEYGFMLVTKAITGPKALETQMKFIYVFDTMKQNIAGMVPGPHAKVLVDLLRSIDEQHQLLLSVLKDMQADPNVVGEVKQLLDEAIQDTVSGRYGLKGETDLGHILADVEEIVGKLPDREVKEHFLSAPPKRVQ